MANVILESVSRVFSRSRISRQDEGPCGKGDGTCDVVAVCELCLDVKDRELLVLVGPSGCGKSTTLRLIAGLDQPSGGVIRIGDRVVNNVAPKDRDIAMVFQNDALYPHMRVRANMAFGLKLRGGEGLARRVLTIFCKIIRPSKAAELIEKRRSIEEQVRRAAKILGIEHLLDYLPSQLSGGERQRVALGRAIVRRPAVFLFDEPLSSLDARLRGGMRRELKELHRRLQTTMIYVTHDQVEAMTLGERIVVMNDGRIQQIGRPEDIYDRPINRFVAGFIGNVPINFLEGQLQRAARDNSGITNESKENTNRKDHERADYLIFRLADFCLPVPDQIAERLRPFEGKAIVLGIRPEDVVRLPGGRSDHSLARLRAVVAGVEHLGDATVIHWDLGAYDLGACRRGRRILIQGKSETRELAKVTSVPIEKTTTVGFDMSRAHWFDPASGNNIALAQPSEIGRK